MTACLLFQFARDCFIVKTNGLQNAGNCGLELLLYILELVEFLHSVAT